MGIHRAAFAVAGLLMGSVSPANAQRAASPPDSAHAEIRTVLRAFYLHLANQNWEALATYVLSPKLLERRGAPGELQTTRRDRTRGDGSSRAAADGVACSPSGSAGVDQADIRVDGEWAEVSVPRCSVASLGTDEFRLLYFEERWRFIYTDLFEAPTNGAERISGSAGGAPR